MQDQSLGQDGAAFTDRRTGLIGWGVFQIVLGAICGVLLLMMGFVMAVVRVLPSKGAVPPPDPRMMAPAVVVYGALAAWFLVAGIGSIKCRRWARAVIAALSWLWLIGGLMGLVFLILFMPDMYGQMAKQGLMPAAMARIMTVFMLAFMAVLYVLLPGGLAWFYSRRDVRATCEARDPHPRWTDGLPLPVLAVALMFWVWAGTLPILGFYGWACPFFGTILTGGAGAGATLGMALLCAGTAWGLGRLRFEGWCAAVGLTLLWAATTGLTFSRHSLLDFYRAMNFPPEQLQMMEQMPMPGMPAMLAVSGLGLLVLLGVLMAIRRHFVGRSDSDGPA